MVIRKHYYVDGRVQGVGFRYRAYYIAQQYGLTGYAVNLDDGRVELEVQGEQALVDSFLNKVEEGYFIRIDSFEAKSMPVDPDDTQFYID